MGANIKRALIRNAPGNSQYAQCRVDVYGNQTSESKGFGL